jgi:sigma-B regulation protein RsbU (phosphoserine phosphatase)
MGNLIDQDIAAVARISAVPTILRVISESTGLGYALVARVTRENWTACAVHDVISFGLKVGDELDVATTLCSQVRDTFNTIVIEHASRDNVYCGHPTPKMYGFESYIAVPIFRANGDYFGTLCALDPRPAKLREPKTVSMMKLFAELISLQLVAEEEHAHSRAALASEKISAELREQFIAMLGHDLRNPLSSIAMGAEILLGQRLPDLVRAATIQRIRKSARRIELLVDDLLDLARGRLGGGIRLTVSEASDLEDRLRHIVDEVASSHPRRTIRFASDPCRTIACDPQRIEQVLSNLLANALTHSDSEAIDVRLRDTTDAVVLSVRNQGRPIPAEVLPQLFQPFYRATAGQARSGLGLGLFIVAEIAKSHGGTVEATSSADEGTVFTFTLPRAKGAEPRNGT